MSGGTNPESLEISKELGYASSNECRTQTIDKLICQIAHVSLTPLYPTYKNFQTGLFRNYVVRIVKKTVNLFKDFDPGSAVDIPILPEPAILHP